MKRKSIFDKCDAAWSRVLKRSFSGDDMAIVGGMWWRMGWRAGYRAAQRKARRTAK